ncbi:Flp pilus assembly complex ATPase component TadA, partial [bacterium]|nr:Flp pilus assembly complex ATPase component TadA [bacterium]
MVTKRNDSSVVQLVDSFLNKAIECSASDVHIEPTPHGARVRYRMDGVLYDKDLIPSSLMVQVISRLKVLSNINIAEKRVPQDGKFRMTVNENEVDLRVSTFPSIYGQKVVVRILDRTKNM